MSKLLQNTWNKISWKFHVTTEMSKLFVHIWHDRMATRPLRLHRQQQQNCDQGMF